jgi:hypothetical protein
VTPLGIYALVLAEGWTLEGLKKEPPSRSYPLCQALLTIGRSFGPGACSQRSRLTWEDLLPIGRLAAFPVNSARWFAGP